MTQKINEILALTDEETQVRFKSHCETMEAQGLEDIKFCLKGYDSVESIQRQFLAIEQMHVEGLTVQVNSLELFNNNYWV